jgi:DNA-binding transcriptional ArsR family regulator
MQVCEALADETRVRIVELLAGRDLSAGELAAHFTVSRPAVSRHLRVLREAGLTTVSRDAQRRVYRLNPAPLRELEAWIVENRRFWEPRLDALGAHLDEVARTRAPRTTGKKGRS